MNRRSFVAFLSGWVAFVFGAKVINASTERIDKSAARLPSPIGKRCVVVQFEGNWNPYKEEKW